VAKYARVVVVPGWMFADLSKLPLYNHILDFGLAWSIN